VIQLLNFIGSISLLLYAACAFVLLLSVRSWLLASRERQRTIYGLEKEVAGERALRALTFGVLSLALGGIVYMAGTNAVPLPAAPSISPTPNLALFITPTATVPPPTPTSAPPTPTPLRGGGPVSTATPVLPRAQQPTPVPPSLPPTAVPPAAECPNPLARIVAPGVDTHLTGVVQVIGSASIPNFQYYKLEYGAGEQPQRWNVIGDLHRRSISDSVLETFNSAALPAGVYYLRLTVVDMSGNFPIAPCAVRVILGS
jgi:hypothetical protein